MDKLKYFQSEFNTQGRRGENDDVTALGRPRTFRFRSISKVLVRLSSNFTHTPLGVLIVPFGVYEL